MKGYAWIVIVLSSFLLFYKYIALVFPSLIAGDIKIHFDLNSAQMGFLSAMFLYCVLLVQPFAGLLLDRFGCRSISTVSLLVSAFGILLFAASTHIVFAFIGRTMMGIGVAFATVSYMKAAATWFDEKGFSVASSLLLTAAMTGAVVGQAPLSALFNAVGWQQGLYCCAIIGVIFAIIYWFVVRDDSKQGPVNVEEEIQSKAEQKSIIHMIKRVIMSHNN
ncbi:MFS transporter [Fastidiosibacter lacustris]|uniref:MFS transporter n=1 Tax=Fastidiosibacter lacustris TaxID=2056695 RepID=UPI000E34FD64|nr:MFS transporter [Fastidiosibacter lacustris]